MHLQPPGSHGALRSNCCLGNNPHFTIVIVLDSVIAMHLPYILYSQWAPKQQEYKVLLRMPAPKQQSRVDRKSVV